MNNYARKIILLFFLFLTCILILSGCSHYKRGEAAEWFKENVVDETIAVSRDYTERKSEEGYTDRVWSAHLKDKHEIEFELISHPTYNLFMDYTMETTYHLEMGKYYLDHYLEEYPGSLDGLDIRESNHQHMLDISGIYDTHGEIRELCSELNCLEDYIARQEFPCSVEYSLAYREPLTFLNTSAPHGTAYRDTYVFETDNTESLEQSALKAFATYAATYRLATDQFTPEQLRDAVNANGNYRFTITRTDGTELCYPGLLLRYSDSMTFGCLYEVLSREGTYDVTGSPEEFTFTSAGGRTCSFSYFYHAPSKSWSEDSGYHTKEVYYYIEDGTQIPLTETPFIDNELFTELTGSTFRTINT